MGGPALLRAAADALSAFPRAVFPLRFLGPLGLT
ncbi:hypothetical protein SALB_00155 [Streptomyces noursei]|uniref:Uncharacterized protein n=1 Tax=Streptomyces noursei TaxID=1971 RepID=A0A401QQ55_STRNR|nr:hypothetical protein SALB_00155 [Streptomyces noursei]